MFRKLKESVSNAVSAATEAATGAASSTDARVNELAAMGFRESEARHAIRVTNGNMEAAAEWLLTHGTPIGVTAAATTTAAGGRHNNNNNTNATPGSRNNPLEVVDDDHQDDIQRAIQASLEDKPTTTTTVKNKKVTTMKPKQSAASKNAGKAAATRRNTGSLSPPTSGNIAAGKKNNNNSSSAAAIASHPKVQVPKRLSQHDKEDVILRVTARIAPHPTAVDTLLRSLKTIQSNPNNPKYQVIDTTTAGFQRSLTAPGVLDFLKAMNFHPDYNNQRVLRLAFLDAATFYLGISALEQVQLTSKSYAYNKAMLQFDKDIEKQLCLANYDTDEAAKRSAFMSKCPSEPMSAASRITVLLGSTTKISRKFDGDDTLRDVINWLGSNASIIPDKLLNSSGSNTKKANKATTDGSDIEMDPSTDDDDDDDCWYLVDRNHADERPYNVVELMDKTLQYIGCWPSGVLAVVPVLKNIGEDDALRIPSSRGLGAGPADHLKM